MPGRYTDVVEVVASVRPDFTLSDYICFAAKPNLVIRVDGHIAKRTFALNDDRSTAGIFNDDEDLTLDNDKLRIIFEAEILPSPSAGNAAAQRGLSEHDRLQRD